MTLKTLLIGSSVPTLMAAFAISVPAAAIHECVPGAPTAASYTWDCKGETNRIFQDIQSDDQRVRSEADHLQSMARDSSLSWQSHEDHLNAVRDAVNDMGAKLCRLEMIRRVVAPWQQKEIDRIATTLRWMADNTEDAIRFGNAHPQDLWMAAYQKYTDDLYDQARTLAHSVGAAVAYARASKDYRNLTREMGTAASS